MLRTHFPFCPFCETMLNPPERGSDEGGCPNPKCGTIYRIVELSRMAALVSRVTCHPNVKGTITEDAELPVWVPKDHGLIFFEGKRAPKRVAFPTVDGPTVLSSALEKHAMQEPPHNPTSPGLFRLAMLANVDR